MKGKHGKSHVLGARWKMTLGEIHAEITADATGGQAIVIPYACEIVDVIVQARAASAGGTALLKKGATAISDAIIMAVDKVIDRAGTIDDAQSSLLPSDTLTVTTNGAADRGLVTVLVRWL